MLSETQLLTIALATVPTILVVAIGILINNHRLNDVNGRFGDMNSRFAGLNNRFAYLNSRFADLKETLRAEIKAGEAAILTQMSQFHMDIISKLAELDNRIARLER